MKKLALAALALAVVIGAGTLLQPQISEMLADRKAEGLVHTCYVLQDPPIYFGVNSYDSETNMLKIEGSLMGMIPLAGDVPRDAVLKDLSEGRLEKAECPPGVFDQE